MVEKILRYVGYLGCRIVPLVQQPPLNHQPGPWRPKPHSLSGGSEGFAAAPDELSCDDEAHRWGLCNFFFTPRAVPLENFMLQKLSGRLSVRDVSWGRFTVGYWVTSVWYDLPRHRAQGLGLPLPAPPLVAGLHRNPFLFFHVRTTHTGLAVWQSPTGWRNEVAVFFCWAKAFSICQSTVDNLVSTKKFSRFEGNRNRWKPTWESERVLPVNESLRLFEPTFCAYVSISQQ